MTGNDILRIVHNRVADPDGLNYVDSFILQNINAAIDFVSKALIKRRAPEMINEALVVDYTQKPYGFHSFVGQPPLYEDGDVIRSYYDRVPVLMRYFRTMPQISSLNDEIQFSEDYKELLVQYVSMLCLNKDEFNTEQEQALIATLNSCCPGVDSNAASK